MVSGPCYLFTAPHHTFITLGHTKHGHGRLYRRDVSANCAVYYKYLPGKPRGNNILMDNTHGVASTMLLARLGGGAIICAGAVLTVA